MYLKWYLVNPDEHQFDDAEVGGAQSFILQEIDRGKLALHNEVGFVIQHRVTAGVILYVCSWRENNEVWESIYFKNLDPRGVFEIVHRDTKTGTFCVWVIPIVAHEQQAWVRYLRSTRDEAAKRAYCVDQLSGLVA
jgi:hypothetical protein